MADFYAVRVDAVEGARATFSLSLIDPQFVMWSPWGRGRPSGRGLALKLLVEAAVRQDVVSPLTEQDESNTCTFYIQSTHLTRSHRDEAYANELRSETGLDLPGDMETEWTLVVRVRDPAWVAHLSPGFTFESTATPTDTDYVDGWEDRIDTFVEDWDDWIEASLKAGTGWDPLPTQFAELWLDYLHGRFTPIVPSSPTSWGGAFIEEHKEAYPEPPVLRYLHDLNIHPIGYTSEDHTLALWRPTPETPLMEMAVLTVDEDGRSPVIRAARWDHYLLQLHDTNARSLAERGRAEEGSRLIASTKAWLAERGGQTEVPDAEAAKRDMRRVRMAFAAAHATVAAPLDQQDEANEPGQSTPRDDEVG